jgi:hypothetical protein
VERCPEEAEMLYSLNEIAIKFSNQDNDVLTL